MARERDTRPYTARSPAGDEDWQAVADALNARMAERRIGQQALSNASGVSVATLRQLQRGMTTGRRAQSHTLSAVACALGWPEDHLIRVLLTGRADREPAEPGMGEIYEALRRLEAQLAAVDSRLGTVERALATAVAGTGS